MPDRNHNCQPGDDDAVVLPFSRQPELPERSSIQDQHWHVERIDTEPMTAQQHDQAVTVLAALIAQWRRHPERVNKTRKKAA